MRFFIKPESTYIRFDKQNLGLDHLLSLFFAVCVLFFTSHPIATAQTVHIPDPELRAALELALDKRTGEAITRADMASLEVLQASRCRFLKRSGIPQWVPISRRCPDERYGTNIQNLTGLEFAINLEELHLAHNRIADLSPLKGLTSLVVLDLHHNFKIPNVLPLKDLKNLTHLSLWRNIVSDVAPLSVLPNLIYLSVENNRISDVSSLEVLTNLKGLDLESNRISDVSSLRHLTNLMYLDFDSNQVSDISPLKDMIHLIQLDISDNLITDVSPLKNMIKMRQMDLDDNQIVDVSPLRNMTELTILDLDGNRIVDISALQNMTKLTQLHLDDNEIIDVSPLENMTRLAKLDLDHNRISDASPLKNLRNLTWLDLDDNLIVDVSPLKNLTRLRLLDLGDNEIIDVSPLKDIIWLTDLDLNDNQAIDISPLQNMTKLTILDLDGNGISDISALRSMIELTDLDLNDNQISNISPLKNLTKLTKLDLSDNQISNFSPIAGLIDNLMEYDASNQTVPSIRVADVNRDGVVNVLDLVVVASNFHNPDLAALTRLNIYPDVNGDSTVDVRDLVTIAAEMGAAAAPAIIKNSIETSNLTVENLTQWIALAKQLDSQEPHLQNGIVILEHLLALLGTIETLPKRTALFPNYPNPFNPETWIPYQLAKPEEVSISIHSADGKLIRTLELGALPAGMYHSKSRAVYWDGRNELGESVANGVYFYTLTAGDFTSTGKMLIRK